MAVGDLLRAEGGDCAGAGFLEFILEGKAAAIEVSAVDAGDEGIYKFRMEIVIASLRSLCDEV